MGQRALLRLSYHVHRLLTPRSLRGSIHWVVGPDELASCLAQIRAAVPGTYAVSFLHEATYDAVYDYGPLRGGPRWRALQRLIVGPLLLGRLMNRARGMLYVGPTGFLLSADEREFELRYVKAKGLKLGLYWTGSDIRSTKVMHALEREMGIPNISTYIGVLTPYFETAAHEATQRRRAEVAMRHADVMFDYPTDQAGYLTCHREPTFFMLSPGHFTDDRSKFDTLDRIVVTHATTSPVIKGTPLVRAAVDKLRAEGYDFEYCELIGVSNAEILAQLRRTHIGLNQFYGFTITVFGVELMAARCAVLSSSDETIETNLPPGLNDAIMVTKHWQVYDHLKRLLDAPELIEPLADRAAAWARRYQSAEGAGPIMTAILDSVLDGSYDAEQRARLTPAERYAAPGTARASRSATAGVSEAENGPA